jgi:hypothetical protein
MRRVTVIFCLFLNLIQLSLHYSNSYSEYIGHLVEEGQKAEQIAGDFLKYWKTLSQANQVESATCQRCTAYSEKPYRSCEELELPANLRDIVLEMIQTAELDSAHGPSPGFQRDYYGPPPLEISLKFTRERRRSVTNLSCLSGDLSTIQMDGQ